MLSFSNSGFPFPYIVRNGKVTQVQLPGFPPGLFPGTEYCEAVASLQSGDASIIGCGPADGNTVHISTHPSSTATAVEDDGGVLPMASRNILGLENYPNPFNPNTIVAFVLNREARVTLRIYDPAGRLVRTLESGRSFVAGRHQLEWDGSDGSGRAVASGVYIVRIDDGREDQTRRMTLVK